MEERQEQSEKQVSHHWGYVGAVISAILFGVSSTFNKIALENVNPTAVAGMILQVFSYLDFISLHCVEKF